MGVKLVVRLVINSSRVVIAANKEGFTRHVILHHTHARFGAFTTSKHGMYDAYTTAHR